MPYEEDLTSETESFPARPQISTKSDPHWREMLAIQ